MIDPLRPQLNQINRALGCCTGLALVALAFSIMSIVMQLW